MARWLDKAVPTMNKRNVATYSAAPGVKGPIVLVEDHGWMQTDRVDKDQAAIDATRPDTRKLRITPKPKPR